MYALWYDRAECLGRPVDYYLLADRWEGAREHYGVEIRWGEETASVPPGLTVSRDGAQELLDRLAKGVVTPVTLWDIVEDWLAE